MSSDTYYKDHWIEIEPERLDSYETMFKWRPDMNPLLEAAGIAAGQTVADFGCGPGFLAIELANRIGPNGHVHALDINADFVARTRARAEAEGYAEQITVHHLTDGGLPFADGILDRIVTKSVMAYVDDPQATFNEFHRVLKTGGKAHAIDSDWGITLLEPVPPEEWNAFIHAAIHVFRSPLIGRQMYGLARQAGFSDVAVQVISRPDIEGRYLTMVKNLANYARHSGKLGEDEIRAVVDRAIRAVEESTFLCLTPQFVITATL
jgi:ubiquinone/menaquinone biosynthesis C-methylase UbiE